MGLGASHAATSINRGFEPTVALFGQFTGTVPTNQAGNRSHLIVDGIASLDAFFIPTETITGGTSSTTATVIAVEKLSNSSQRLLIEITSLSAFQNNEALTGGDSGVGVVDGVDEPAPVNVKGKGTHAIVALSSATGGGVGRYEITLTDAWRGLLAAKFAVKDATSPDDWEVVVQSEAVATTKKIVIYTFKGGTAASLTDDDKLYYSLVMALEKTAPAGF